MRDPLFLSAKNDETKATGYYLDSLHGFGKPKKLAMWEAAVSGLGRAKKADRVFFSLSRFDQYPDILTTGLDFAAPKRLTFACPEQAEVRWGRSELVSWRNSDGVRLQGILVKPEGFDPKKKYR